MPEANKRYGKSLPETINPPARVCFLIEIPDTQQYRAALMGQLEWLADWRCWEHYQEDYAMPPARNIEAAQLWAIAVTEACQFMQCPMTCEEMMMCLQPLFDAQTAQISSLQEQVEQLQDALQGNRAKEKELPPVAATNAIYAGALAVVQYMDKKNRAIYKEAEDSFVDNAGEMTSAILSKIPNVTTVEVGAGAELANQYFQLQVTDYIEQYDDFEFPAAESLYCFIIANDDVMNIDVWGDWLDGLDTLLPESAPAALYAKYSPLRQTFLNQIAELINGEQTLQSYFDETLQAYYTGTTTPVVPPEPLDCEPTYTVTNVGIITECGTGAIETRVVHQNEAFTMDGYLLSGTTYVLALRLPVGSWRVTMNSFTGSIVPPADTNQDAYAYWDTSGILQHIQWNAPAAPDDFGTQDTTQQGFAPWCSTEVFNAAIFNEAPFSVSFTIEALP